MYNESTHLGQEEPTVMELDITELATKKTRSIALYESIRDELFELIMDGYRDEEIVLKINDEGYLIPVNILTFAFVLLRSRLSFERDWTIEDVVLNVDTASTNKVISSYYTGTLDEGFTAGYDMSKVKDDIASAVTDFSTLTWNLNARVGNSVNIYDIIHLMKDNATVRNALNFTCDETLQFSEIEESISKVNDALVEELRKSDTCYRALLPVTPIKQFQQVFTNVGLKPDLFGRVIPKPINTSFFRGMRDSTDFFINAAGARKALVINAVQVGKAGYLTRKLCWLLIRCQLADIEDCGAKPIEVTMKDKKFLSRFHGRFMVGPRGKLKVIDKDDVSLIGKTIKLRSPITCQAGHNGDDKICHTCFGQDAKKVSFHIGLTAAIYLTEQFTQKLLSSKHLLQVFASAIALNEILSKYLKIERNVVSLTEDIDIRFEDLEYDHETGRHKVSSFYISDEEQPQDVSELGFVPTQVLLSNIDSELKLKGQKGMEIFTIEVENNEVSKPLRHFIRTIENQEELSLAANGTGDLSALLTRLIELLEEGGIKLSAKNLEMVVRCIARNPNHIEERFSDIENVQLLTVPQAIFNNNSLSVSIAYEQLRNVIERSAFAKSGRSIIDSFFNLEPSN